MSQAATWLIAIGLSNAALATVLAAIAWALGRFWRWPSMAHLLWVVVLAKLVTPPLVQVPLGWQLDISSAKALPSIPSPEQNRSHQATADLLPDGRAFDPPPLASDADQLAPRATQAGVTTIREPVSGEIRPRAGAAVRTPAIVPGIRVTRPLQTAIQTLTQWLPVIWLTGTLLSLAVLMRRAFFFHRFIQRASRPDRSLSLRVQQLARAAGFKDSPTVILVQGAVSPMLWGVGPAIRLIFPAQLAGSLPSEARDALLLHELAHYTRGDQWVRVLELIARSLYWWHPVVWWSCREIEVAEEQCCDAWVIERQSGTPRCYAEALLATIDFLCEQPVLLPPVASGLGDVPMLRLRLTQIMRGNVAAHLPSGVKIAALVAALVTLPVGPALFGASVTPKLAPRARTPVTQSRSATLDTTNPENSPTSPAAGAASGPADSIAQPSSTFMLPAAVRPPAVVTATAVSRNGKYRLERRKGSHVTLVNQTTDWRLDMSTHGILCVAFTPDSRSFVTGHADGLVRIWDSETGGLASTLRGCTDAVWSIAVSAGINDDFQLAAGGKDGSVLVWNLASGEETARLPPTDLSVSCVRWSPSGDKLVISFGDFSDREESALLIWSPHENLILSQASLDRPAAALAWLAGEDRLLVADWKGDAAVLVAGAPLPYRPLLDRGAKEMAEAAHWSPDCPLKPAWPLEELAFASQAITNTE